MTFTWQPIKLDAVSSDVMLERLLTAAQHELAEHGVLGFRTSSVARRANCSISLIYRYFVDRDGLIVRVLSDMFYKLQNDYVDGIIKHVEGMKTITPADIAALVPNLDKIGESPNMKWRTLALAISMESAELRENVQATIEQVRPKWFRFFELVSEKLEKGSKIDIRVFTMILSMSLPYYNSLLGEYRVDDASYKAYLTELLNKKKSK